MKPPFVRIILVIGFPIAMLCLSGCSSVTSIDSTPAPLISPSSALLLPGETLQFNATVNGVPLANPVWLVDKVFGGSSDTGTITSSGLYSAPAGLTPNAVQISVSDVAHRARSTPVTVFFFERNHFQPGTVSASNNPLVALYTLAVPQGAMAQIQFGTTTNYGLKTWAQPAPENGGYVSILVGGMRASTTYHMQALIRLPNATTVLDTDKVFTTGVLPANVLPNLTAQLPEGRTPSAGIEMLSLFDGSSQTQLTAVVSDLAGNVIWYYPIQPSAAFPLKLLPNGHILVLVSAINTVQEIDLAGNIISQTSLGDVQNGLAAAGVSFPDLYSMHHDMIKLPNGHLILLVNYNQTFSDQPGISTVLGDALIDWDPLRGPVWTWSTFDHIPLTHAPNGTADWTHSNAVVYSPDDGNLILSMRNQNWIIKINYENGEGDGRILWHFGPNGDFALTNAQAPIEWNYGQHYPVLLGPNTAGSFPMMFFNNGNNRLVDVSNDVCGTPGLAACYSSIPVFQLNEYSNTAEVLDEINLTPAYSLCCGSAGVLANGDFEYDVALDVYTPGVSYIQEVTRDQPPQLVWQMNVTGQLAYRGFRIPSLYPGVEWTQSAIATANFGATLQTAPKIAGQ